MKLGRVAALLFVVATMAIRSRADAPVVQVPPLPLTIASVTPEDSGDLVSTTLWVHPRGGTWTLSLLRDASVARCGMSELFDCGDPVFVRSAATEWRPLIPGIPLQIASGDSLSGDVPVPLQFQVKPTWATPTSQRRAIVRAVVGAYASDTFSILYRVDPAALMIPDSRPFDSPVVDPARQTTFTYEPRDYVVYSNVRWRLEVSLNQPLKIDSGVDTMDRGLQVVNAAGQRMPLTPGGTAVVATGPPTGSDGFAVPIQLIAAPPPGQVGGTYASRIAVAVKMEGAADRRTTTSMTDR